MRHLTHVTRTVAATLAEGVVPLPRRARPQLATLNLTENCQSRCVMCDYWMESKRNHISTARAVDLVGELDELGVPALRFLGGEPLLRKDLFQVLEAAGSGGFQRVTLATNGLLLERFAEAVNASAVTHITVSLDGHGILHDRIRGIEGGFDQILEGLRRLRGKRIKIASLVTGALARDVPLMLELCRENGWDYDVVLPSFDLPYAKNGACVDALKDLWPDEEQSKSILSAMVQAGRLGKPMARAALRYLTHREYPQTRCVLGYVQLQVRANGDLLSGCYELEPMGNVLHQSIPDIVDSEAYRERIRRMFRMECPKCVCGWQISFAAQHPFASVRYALRRLGGRAPGPIKPQRPPVARPGRRLPLPVVAGDLRPPTRS